MPMDSQRADGTRKNSEAFKTGMFVTRYRASTE